jgi:hypothetical protein
LYPSSSSSPSLFSAFPTAFRGARRDPARQIAPLLFFFIFFLILHTRAPLKRKEKGKEKKKGGCGGLATHFEAHFAFQSDDTTKAFPHRDATAGHRRTPPSTLFNGNLFSLDITCVCGSLLYDCWFFCLRRENLLQDTQPITNTTRGSLPFRFAKEVSSLLVSFIPLAFASRCGNDVVVSSEWKAKRASKWGATPHTPLFFSFEGRASVQDQKEDEEEGEVAIWRAGPRRAHLDAHRDVGKAEKREGAEEEEDRREKARR